MRIRLKERRQETADVISFVFDLNNQPLEYRPGQYAFFELDELAVPDERGKRRHFTLSSSPTERGVVMVTTRIRGSGFKETLRLAPLELQLTMEPPRGLFVLPAEEARRHIFIAGGIGVTPYRSILRQAADSNTPVRALMLYLHRSTEEIIFGRELKEIAEEMATFSFKDITDDPYPGWEREWRDRKSRLVLDYVPERERSIFWISGPPPMVDAFKDVILNIGLSEDSIRTDSFSGY